MRFRIIAFLFFMTSSGALIAQESLSQYDYLQGIEKADALYDQDLYPAAYKEYKDFIAIATDKSIDELLISRIHLRMAICQARTRDSGGEHELLSYIESKVASPYLHVANIELADFYYYKKDYRSAVQYFREVDLEAFDNERYSELVFKRAYSHFVRKDFAMAKDLLQKILHLKNEFYYPANYYHGMSQYFLEDLDEAVSSFQKLENSSAYQDRIPYYISQIYFMQKKYEDLLGYGNEVITVPGTENVKEIRGLLGQTYFIQKDYEKAVEHLSFYIDNSQKLRAEDFYQLGFAYYKLTLYAKAIPYFEEIANEQTKMGQNANNYLGECYLKTDQRDKARAAFFRTSEMKFIPDLADEALFNYGKLSADMKMDREALNSLKQVTPESIYFREAQGILSYILSNTKDYAEALRFIEDLDMVSPVLKESYQKLSYLFGMQFLVDEDEAQAKKYFEQSLASPINNEYVALAYYRMADIQHNQRIYNGSINFLNQFITIAQTGVRLPADVQLPYAYYLQAYNYLKTENYAIARKFFKDAAEGFTSKEESKLAMDALLRAGDCYFRINAYRDAIVFYNKAIELGRTGTDYAYYQRGILQGLLGLPFEKIVSLDALIQKYPKSPLADYAIYQNGETLQAINEPIEAERSFRSIVDNYPNSNLRNKSLLKLGLIAFNRGDMNTAISYYKDLFNKNPSAEESQESIIALEEIYVDNLGQPEEFFSFVEQQGGFTLSTFEKDSISFRSGDIPFENGNYQKAIEAYSSYLRNYPKGFNRLLAHYRRAESYSIMKQYEQALNDYEYVIKKNQSKYYASSLFKSAIIAYNYTEDFKKAFDYYSLLEEISNEPEKRYEAQMGALRSAVRIDDNDATAYMSKRVLENPLIKSDDKALAHFHLGKVQSIKKDNIQAVINLDQAIIFSNNANTAEARYIKARILLEEGKIPEAEAMARDAIVNSKPYPYWVAKSMMVLSDVFVSSNDLLQAKAALKAIIDNFDQDPDLTTEAKSRLIKVQQIEESNTRIDDAKSDGDLDMIDATKNKKGNE